MHSGGRFASADEYFGCQQPSFNVYLAAQVKLKDKGFLSRDICVADLVSLKGDVHHIFPKNT
jgi:hypothetical protein